MLLVGRREVRGGAVFQHVACCVDEGRRFRSALLGGVRRAPRRLPESEPAIMGAAARLLVALRWVPDYRGRDCLFTCLDEANTRGMSCRHDAREQRADPLPRRANCGAANVEDDARDLR